MGARTNSRGNKTQTYFRGGLGMPNNIYRWKPSDQNKLIFPTRTRKTIHCNATPGSQGFDNDTGYCYRVDIVGGVETHIAYVECDYVE